MPRVALGPLHLDVDHRAPGPEGGPTLRVRRASDARELLRFDCFAVGAHWHADPAGRDEITRLAPAADALEWTLAELRRDLPGYLAKAGVAGEGDLDPAETQRALARVESALRNPPARLDDLDPDWLRQRSGEKWRVYPDDVLPLWVADMDFPQAEPIRRRLQRMLDTGDLGYPLHPRPTGIPELFAERAEARYGWRVEPRRVELVADVVQGIHVALDRFTRPGDGVVVQTPIYPPFLSAVRETKRELLENPLVQGPSGFELDLDGLGRLAPRARMLLLCHPHNPTGRAFTREELDAVAEIALAHDAWIVSDEIHADLTYGGTPHLPVADLAPEVAARTIALHSASKAFNVAGLRCAVAAFGNDATRRRFLELPRHLRGGLSATGLEATAAAWRHAGPWLEEVLAYLQANRDHLAEVVARDLPGVRFHPPEATYLAWLDCRALDLEPTPYEFFLDRARVALSDGRAFGAPGQGFVRLNFATSRDILDDALERMVRALRER